MKREGGVMGALWRLFSGDAEGAGVSEGGKMGALRRLFSGEADTEKHQ